MPDNLVEADVAAVQGVRPVVGGELVGLAVEREFTLGNAVAVAPNQRPKVGVGLAESRALVAAHLVEAQNYITQLTRPVRHEQAGERAAEIADGSLQAVGVGEGVELHGGAGSGIAKRGAGGHKSGS